MIGRVLLAALLAGIAAGIIMGAIQHFRLTPFILQAEVFEEAQPHEHAGADWEPAEGLERTAFTTVASMMAGAGFAALLAGVSLVAGVPITARNGAVWGLCGFLAVTLAPAAGLPPELPGMPAGDLMARQIWWVGTIIATGLGLYLIAARREAWAIIAAVALIALPHLIGAPQAASHETAVPAGLAAQFAANSIAVNAVFWALIGTFLGLALNRANAQDLTA
jgi:cobalt transporter subunit CbtA